MNEDDGKKWATNMVDNDLEDKKRIHLNSRDTIFAIIIVALALSFISLMVCLMLSEEEKSIVEIDNSNIKITDKNFYLLYEDEEIEIRESVDLSKNSSVYIKLWRLKPYFIFPGTDWQIQTILKTP